MWGEQRGAMSSSSKVEQLTFLAHICPPVGGVRVKVCKASVDLGRQQELTQHQRNLKALSTAICEWPVGPLWPGMLSQRQHQGMWWEIMATSQACGWGQIMTLSNESG